MLQLNSENHLMAVIRQANVLFTSDDLPVVEMLEEIMEKNKTTNKAGAIKWALEQNLRMKDFVNWVSYSVNEGIHHTIGFEEEFNVKIKSIERHSLRTRKPFVSKGTI